MLLGTSVKSTIKEAVLLVLLPSVTVTEPVVPAEVMSLALIDAVSWVEDLKLVVRFEPFHLTTELVVKFVPLTVRVKCRESPSGRCPSLVALWSPSLCW